MTIDHRRHSPYSNPGRFEDLVRNVPTDIAELSAVARNLIVHYRASGLELPTTSRSDINARWLEDTLAIDQSRHARPFDEPRQSVDRVQGCCRDHTLFCVGVLRTNGIEARSRVGYAGYFVDGWNYDHVVVEAMLDGRWQRFDAELESASAIIPDPTDIGHCEPGVGGFVSAAQVWVAYRSGDLNPENYGVAPELPLFTGERFIFDEVIFEVAHRFGDELLLWDAWGRMEEPGTPVSDVDAAWLDPIAALLLAADAGDEDAQQRLFDNYRADDGLRPLTTIFQASPFGDPPIEVDLTRS